MLVLIHVLMVMQEMNQQENAKLVFGVVKHVMDLNIMNVQLVRIISI